MQKLFYIIVLIIYIKIFVKVDSKTIFKTEFYIPFFIEDNKITRNISNNINGLLNQFQGKIYLINTRNQEKFFKRYINNHENIEERTYPRYLYKRINLLTTLSKIYMVQLQCFKIAIDSMENNMDGIFIMEQDVQLKKNSFVVMQNYIHELNSKLKSKFIVDFYNYFLFDSQNQKGTSWYNRLLGKIKNGFENQHVYEKNNCMGIQLMYYPKEIIHVLYNCLKTFYIDKIHLTNLAIDNCLTYCCGINKIKILTTKQQLLIHRRFGSTWDKNIRKKEPNCHPIEHNEDVSYCMKLYNNNSFVINTTNNIC